MKLKNNYFIFGIAGLVAVLVFVSYSLGFFAGLENFFEDLLFSSKQIQNYITIVSIDNESIQKIGQWPWPREIFAKAFSILDENPPAAVGLDVIFSEPSRSGSSDDMALVQVMEKLSYPVVMPVEALPLIIDGKGIGRAENFCRY